MFLLEWQNLIFLIPLTVGVLLAAGSAFHSDEHPDNTDDVHSHEHERPEASVHQLDGGDSERRHPHAELEQVPPSLMLMTASLVFGGTGALLTTLQGSWDKPSVHAVMPLMGAAVMGLLTSRPLARLLVRVMPRVETYPVTRTGLVGMTGTLVLPASAASGLAQVKDQEGNLHQVRCVSLNGALTKGSTIVVVEHEPETNRYAVAAYQEQSHVRRT